MFLIKESKKAIYRFIRILKSCKFNHTIINLNNDDIISNEKHSEDNGLIIEFLNKNVKNLDDIMRLRKSLKFILPLDLKINYSNIKKNKPVLRTIDSEKRINKVNNRFYKYSINEYYIFDNLHKMKSFIFNLKKSSRYKMDSQKLSNKFYFYNDKVLLLVRNTISNEEYDNFIKIFSILKNNITKKTLNDENYFIHMKSYGYFLKINCKEKIGELNGLEPFYKSKNGNEIYWKDDTKIYRKSKLWNFRKNKNKIYSIGDNEIHYVLCNGNHNNPMDKDTNFRYHYGESDIIRLMKENISYTTKYEDNEKLIMSIRKELSYN